MPLHSLSCVGALVVGERVGAIVGSSVGRIEGALVALAGRFVVVVGAVVRSERGGNVVGELVVGASVVGAFELGEVGAVVVGLKLGGRVVG